MADYDATDEELEDREAEAVNEETKRMWKLVGSLRKNLEKRGPEARASPVWVQVALEVDEIRRKLEPRWLNEAMDVWPIGKATPEERKEISRAVKSVMNDCRRQGGLEDRCRSALVEAADPEEYCRLLNIWRSRLEREAFYPFWRRHCVILDGFEIQNELNGAIWRQGEDGKRRWYLDGKPYTDRFPPGDVRKIVQAHKTASEAFKEGGSS